MSDLIVSVPDHCLSFYFPLYLLTKFFVSPAELVTSNRVSPALLFLGFLA